jgi:hypothetical protein
MKVKQQGSLGKAWKVTMAYFRSIFQTAEPMIVMRPFDISSAPRNIKVSKVQ